MERFGSDEAMLDVVEPSIEESITQNGRDLSGFANGTTPSSLRGPSLVLNGLDTGTQSPLARSRDESIASSSKRGRGKTEETNGLIAQVSNMLSIESPPLTPPFKRTPSDEFIDTKHQLQVAMLPTGLCYDVRMRFHCELMPLNSTEDHHPEEPRRIFAIYQELCKAGLVDDPISTRPLVPQPLLRIMARKATSQEIGTVHDARHYEFVQSLKTKEIDELKMLEGEYDSVYFNPLTFTSALLSAGGAIETCKAVVSRQLKNGIAIIRPPGHHAERTRPSGFCFFDNCAIAAKVCQMDYPDTCRKILILDWDVHHGNGIQQAFETDPNVLYISIHVYQNGSFYPQGTYGNHEHCGKEAGEGKNINIPWDKQGMGDADYMYAFQRVVMPVAYEFNPDLVIIAAGFDAAQGDHLGGCHVSPAGYGHMTHMLMSLAGGRVVACLEGGYNLRAISKSALAVTKVLMGEPPDRLPETKPTDSGRDTVRMVATYQSKYWTSLGPKDLKESTVGYGADRLHDVIRYFQAARMLDEHKMISLCILREQISRSFEKQVLATTNYTQRVPLVVFLHDPPEILGAPDPLTKKLEMHNTWLADGLKHYVDWAARQGYAVIDVNVPKFLTGIDNDGGYHRENEDRPERLENVEQLMVYLWENYIEVHPTTELFFVGVGSAYHGILHLLDTRPQVFKRATAIVNFVSQTRLVPISDSTTYWLSKWYRMNSKVFVGRSHPIYTEADRKTPKRVGSLIKSSSASLHGMLMAHQEEVQNYISSLVRSMPAKGTFNPGFSGAGRLSQRTPADGGRTLGSPRVSDSAELLDLQGRTERSRALDRLQGLID